MNQITIARADRLYCCFPDVVKAPDGTLVCGYQETQGHAPFPFSRLVLRKSVDGGFSWGPKQVLLQTAVPEEWFDGESSKKATDEHTLTEWEEARDKANMPPGNVGGARFLALRDGTIWFTGGWSNPSLKNDASRSFVWKSRDNGETWQGPEDLALPKSAGHGCLTELRDGRIIAALTVTNEWAESKAELRRLGVNDVPEAQFASISEDSGKTWSSLVLMPYNGLWFSEGSIVELDNDTLVCYTRESREARCCYKFVSEDSGLTWHGPYPTYMFSCQGRPKAAKLSTGEICVTYRYCGPNEVLTMYVETQAGAMVKQVHGVDRQPLPPDSKDPRFTDDGGYNYHPGRTFFISHDRSPHPDSGYTGWVELDNGDVYVVDYVNDDAPMAQIRGYIVSRYDYYLFPRGDIRWWHPAWQRYEQKRQEAAREQFRLLRKRKNN